MNKDWRLSKKGRLRLCELRKKPNLANLKRKKREDHKNNDEIIIMYIDSYIVNIFFVLIYKLK